MDDFDDRLGKVEGTSIRTEAKLDSHIETQERDFREIKTVLGRNSEHIHCIKRSMDKQKGWMAGFSAAFALLGGVLFLAGKKLLGL